MEEGIWEMLQMVIKSEPHSLLPYYRQALFSVGFDVRRATCGRCKSEKPEYMIPAEQDFFCDLCSSLMHDSREKFKVASYSA